MHQPFNALLCSGKLTMKSAIILQHKYFILHLDADFHVAPGIQMGSVSSAK